MTGSTAENVTRDLEQGMVDGLVQKAQAALRKLAGLNQVEIDRIVQAMTLSGLDRHMELARLAVEETGRGIYEDKITKNIFATEYIYNSIKNQRTVGVINRNDEEGFSEIAEPVGVIAGITPVTNPTSTVLFKSLIAIKTRNPIIFGFHPGAQQSSAAAAKTVLDAAVAAGAPPDCIGWIEQPSLNATRQLMSHPGVALILATGGSGLVQAAYSCGKPALGVGPGNVPCYIEKTAVLKRAVTDIILSKTFDNGMICASEQGLIVDREIAAEVKRLLVENGCYFLGPEEAQALENLATAGRTSSINPDVVGQPAAKIAIMAGFVVPETTKILIVPLEGIGPDFPLSREKLSPILAYYVVDGYREGIERCRQMVEFGGMGHSAVIHSEDEQVMESFAASIPVGRIIVNAPSSHGAIGDIYNTNIPSLTLGCGSYGHNSTTDNVSAVNLLNIFSTSKLDSIEKDLAGLKICYELTPDMLKTNHFCTKCNFLIGEAGVPVKGRLDEIEDRIDNLLAEWTNTLFNTVTDPTLEEQKQFLSPEQRKVIDEFIKVKTLPEKIDQFFITAIEDLLQGFEPVTIAAEDLIDKLGALGPCDIETFQRKLKDLLNGYTRGKDKEKLRIIVKR